MNFSTPTCVHAMCSCLEKAIKARRDDPHWEESATIHFGAAMGWLSMINNEATKVRATELCAAAYQAIYRKESFREKLTRVIKEVLQSH